MKRQVSTISKFTQLTSKALVAFYQVAQRFAKCKTPHSIAEEIILPAVINLASAMMGERSCQKIKVSTDIL